MSRHRRGGWAGAGTWPFMTYGQQFGADWREQTMDIGFGQRRGRAHDLCSRSNHSDGLDQPLSLETHPWPRRAGRLGM
ncbi:hypothetical protein N0V93_008593 [Gnomoniopsis smithogilvyi]|uniref:Uncharacterized protein n=1 Tax=Gnomoniopsis smithogilvyi TaxID=1191159 RepID=A0A9W9CTU8_9PEZI|nr:hypothetical protein N0V93_008593 [Gnomoniopsis smithogilvyi]